MTLLNITKNISHIAVLILLIVPVVLYFYLKLSRRQVKYPIVKNWMKDMVYLCQFPCSPEMRSISPFALKLETWLRLTGVQYTNVYTTTFSKSTKTIPYIELNGEEIADSSLIIDRFKKMFEVNPDKYLSPEEHALSHTIQRMTECSTIKYAFYWRYGKMMPFFYDSAVRKWEQTRKLTFGFKTVQPLVSRIRAHFSGVSRLSNSDQLAQCKKDFAALSTILGEKEYFLGTENPTTVDCVVFGIIVQFFLTPSASSCPALENSINHSYRNLSYFVKRIQNKLWPDWDEMCSSMGFKTGVEGKTFGTLTPVKTSQKPPCKTPSVIRSRANARKS